uniref:Uncharacterized protein n=1 Tax=Meloidogyne incognita TaxID=6306 RepID=A0A914LLU0_MELIC
MTVLMNQLWAHPIDSHYVQFVYEVQPDGPIPLSINWRLNRAISSLLSECECGETIIY